MVRFPNRRHTKIMITESNNTLRKFNLFSDFTNEQFSFIKNNASQMVIPEKKVLLKLGAEHNIIFILLKGRLKLTARDHKEEIISADSKRAANAIAQIRPSMYKVSSLTQITIISLSEETLAHAVAMQEAEETDKILSDILNLLHNDKLVLPSMPDIALKIRGAVEDNESDLNDVVKIINMDQSIATKIINTANSAMYNISGKNIENCKIACMRLGGKMIMNLVLSYSMKELFYSRSLLFKNKMNEMWQHSVKVAAISSILARLTPGFDPEKALLAGLLHNIGAVVILNYLSGKQKKIEDPALLDNMLFALQSEVGEILLNKWEFSGDLVDVAKYSTDLFHDESDKADYVDIINIAQVHSYVGTPHQQDLPIIDQIPAFSKLALGQLTPELSIRVLSTSQAEIDRTIALFS